MYLTPLACFAQAKQRGDPLGYVFRRKGYSNFGKEKEMRRETFLNRVFAISILLALVTLFVSTTVAEGAKTTSDKIERWGIFEVSLKGPSGGNPFIDVELSAQFRQGSRVFEPAGFYDGNGVYRVRFMPDELGEWRYLTKSNRSELDGKTGKFTCVKLSPGNHGPVRVRNTCYFAYADGTPYFQIGTTCYAWVHQPDAMEEQTLATLRDAPFNKMRMCVFPKDYVYNKNEPQYYPFEGKPPKDWDYSRFNPEFFRHFEQRVGDLRELGIEADIILFHPYDRWDFSRMNSETDDRYLRYIVARLSAYCNVWWSMANEFDHMFKIENKQMADWDRFFQIVQKNDPYNRLRGIHNGRVWYDHTKPWVTHASIQSSDLASGKEWRNKYRKPIVFDECKYEGNIPKGWGSITAIEMVRRFWLGTLSGCYVGHGETYLHLQDLLWWSKGGVLRGESPVRIAYLKDFMADAPPFEQLVPIPAKAGTSENDLYVLAKPGQYYLVYFVNPQTITLDLTGNQPYKIDGIDPWEMKLAPIGTAGAGKYTFSSSRSDYIYRFTPYRAGEKIRPEARATANKTLGSVPLEVKFSAAGKLKQHWDFGDGTSSSEANPTHTYKRFGRYTATLTVTDDEDASATTALSINVLPGAPKDLGQYKAWPGSHSGLVFLWGNNEQSNRIVDSDGKTVRTCRVEARGKAKLGRRSEMDIAGGAFLARDINNELLSACKLSNQLTIEAVITPDNINQRGPARIVTFSKDNSSRNFTIGQQGKTLVLRLRTPETGPNGLNPQVNLCKVKAGEVLHLLVSYFPGHLYCYVNGKEVFTSTDIQGDFSNWENYELLFGDEYNGGRSWAGQIKAVAIYNRFVGPEETAHKHALYNKHLKNPKPTPDDIGKPQQSQRKKNPDAKVKSTRTPPSYADVRYGRYERNVLDFWKAESLAPTPVLVYFHGGGFRGGDKKSYNPFFLQSCMASGISFAAANYRLSGQAEYPAQMHDSARAIQYLRSKAKQWNIDPARIAAFGGSAGSGISLWLAFHDDLAEPQSNNPVARQSSRLNCALAMQMQCTYDPREIKKIVPGNAYDHLALKQLFGLPDDWDWDADEVDETLSARLKDASPITHLTRDDPPVFLYHRKAQETPGNIHHANFGRHLKKAMDELGIECIHRLDSDYENSEAASRDMAQFIKKHLGVR